MVISSQAFKHNSFIPSKYTCHGDNINPPLEIKDVPKKAKSLVLIVDDPDAPSGTFTHWTVWNVSPTITQINEGSVPAGAVEGQTDFGESDYGGPCPPSGTHRYFFKLYALDIALNLTSEAEKRDLEKAIKGHILDEATLVGLYRR
jgi:Raf kinase inhibitor-like YbhB/YbcL family protein